VGAKSSLGRCVITLPLLPRSAAGCRDGGYCARGRHLGGRLRPAIRSSAPIRLVLRTTSIVGCKSDGSSARGWIVGK
jgi:hypothetical protein